MTAGWRYALMQVPGIVLIAILLAFALHLDWMSESLAWSVFALWVVKDVAFFPLVSRALGRRPHTGPQSMVGQTAVVVRPLEPHGTVRLAGELWRAEAVAGGPIAAGASIEVESVEGLVLRVRPSPGREPAA